MLNGRPAADTFDFIANFVGTILMQIAGPTYDDYLLRQQDMAAALRLGATVIWLRDTQGSGMPLHERIERRPAWMHVDARRALRMSEDRRHLSVGWYGKRMEALSEWPLPADL